MKISLKDKRTVFELILVAIILVMLAILLIPKKSGSTVTLYYYTPESNYSTEVEKGEAVLLGEGPEIEGYNFTGWRDSFGNIVKSEHYAAEADAYFTAVYAITFDTEKHMTFLDNEEGVFRPVDALTRREAAVMFYRLMNTGKSGSGKFEDVAEDDPCYLAAATLKDLGVFYGNYFHPDDTMTRGEFISLLSDFYPAAKNGYSFKDIDSSNAFYPVFCIAAENGWIESGDSAAADPDGPMLRADAAVLMCKLLGRTGDAEKDLNKTGTFLDVDKNSDYYWAVAEACIPHEYEAGESGEVWTKSEPLPEHKPGYFYVGVALHYIDENGEPLINGTVDGLNFNERGEETSGDEKLDRLIHAAMKQIVDPKTQQKSEMLKALYKWVADPENFRYLTRNYYQTGDTSWVVDEATTMLETEKGNCYNFAAVFYEFARAVGYDAKIYSGTMGDDHRPHAWVEIEFDGQPYIYDAEYEYAHTGYSDAFKRDADYAARYKYHKEGKSPNAEQKD